MVEVFEKVETPYIVPRNNRSGHTIIISPFTVTCRQCAFFTEGCPIGRMTNQRACLEFVGKRYNYCPQNDGRCMTEAIQGCDGCSWNNLKYRDMRHHHKVMTKYKFKSLITE